jgi:hypothetical protein
VSSVKKPIPLAACIFMPFTGCGPTPARPLSPTEKLTKIIKNVSKQQEIVKSNMIFIFEGYAEDLTAAAKKEVSETVGYTGSQYDDPHGKERRKEAVDAMFQRTKAPARLYKVNLLSGDMNGIGFRDGSNATTDAAINDVEMGGKTTDLDTNMSKPKTAGDIYRKLNKDLQDLVGKGVRQLEMYENHSRKVTEFYQQALDRRTGGVPASIRRKATGGALDTSVSINTDEYVRRSPRGMHLAGKRVQRASVYEGVDDLARGRGR